MAANLGADAFNWMDAERERFEVPGIAVAVVQQGAPILCQGFGLRDVAHDLPVTTHTSFALASITKSFTASLIGALVDDGLLEWDRPIRHYLGGFSMFDHVATERITVRDLLSHRSGLPRHDALWSNNSDLSREEAVRRLRYVQPNRDLREAYQYNNLMYLTAGHLAEEVSGVTYPDLVRARLLEPLDMVATSARPDASLAGEVCIPYAEREGRIRAVEASAESRSEAGAPAGSIYSTLSDMLVWLEVNLSGGRWREQQVLSASTIRELHSPQIVIREGTLFPEAPDTAYGLGWTIGSYRGHRVVHHGGNLDGFCPLISMLPDDGVGVVFLSNRGNSYLRHAVTWMAFDRCLGLKPLPWGVRIKEVVDAMKAGGEQAKASAPRVEGAQPSHPLGDYAGVFAHPGYGELEVVHEDGGLRPGWRGMPATLTHRHFDIFDFKPGAAGDAEFTASFLTDPQGDISEVEIPLDSLSDPIVFKRLTDRSRSDQPVGRA